MSQEERGGQKYSVLLRSGADRHARPTTATNAGLRERQELEERRKNMFN